MMMEPYFDASFLCLELRAYAHAAAPFLLPSPDLNDRPVGQSATRIIITDM